MGILRMVYFTRLLLVFLTFLGLYATAQCQLDEMAFISEAQCHGADSFGNVTCSMSSSIALINVRVGTRPTTSGCLGNETNGDGTGCCQSASDASESDPCEFYFPISDNVLFHDQCNGRQFCQPGVQIIDVIHGSCNTSVYPAFTQYMYFNFFCIEDSRISGMDSSHLTFENATIYLQSPDYTSSAISSSVSELSCSVETDNCNAAIFVYVIELNLADVVNSTQCAQTQSLSIIEEDGSTLVNWTCNDNTYTISQPLQTAGNYILVTFTNSMPTNGGKFWIGFQASLPSNLTLECPAVDKQYCFPTSSTTTSSSTTLTTTSSTSSTTSTNSTSSTTSTTSTTTKTSSTTTKAKSTSSSLSTQRTVTSLTTLTSRISTTSRPQNRANTNNTWERATAVSAGIVFAGLIAAFFGFRKIKNRQHKKKSTTESGSADVPKGSGPTKPEESESTKPGGNLFVVNIDEIRTTDVTDFPSIQNDEEPVVNVPEPTPEESNPTKPEGISPTQGMSEVPGRENDEGPKINVPGPSPEGSNPTKPEGISPTPGMSEVPGRENDEEPKINVPGPTSEGSNPTKQERIPPTPGVSEVPGRQNDEEPKVNVLGPTSEGSNPTKPEGIPPTPGVSEVPGRQKDEEPKMNVPGPTPEGSNPTKPEGNSPTLGVSEVPGRQNDDEPKVNVPGPTPEWIVLPKPEPPFVKNVNR